MNCIKLNRSYPQPLKQKTLRSVKHRSTQIAFRYLMLPSNLIDIIVGNVQKILFPLYCLIELLITGLLPARQ